MTAFSKGCSGRGKPGLGGSDFVQEINPWPVRAMLNFAVFYEVGILAARMQPSCSKNGENGELDNSEGIIAVAVSDCTPHGSNCAADSRFRIEESSSVSK
ncbi:MAG TPA: hypothetical protein DCR95_10400 [Desulfobacter sp.]|uniref:hypothetical protein n=1 Tax=Desulfobacter sp. UBA2225 TaxID=1961413 RepID=UPI000E826C6E|nr:hypothetical protein [Desulfobacter sp. UBA2225]HAR34464.1 hypothetical protein [Desulfobacter sp.]